MKKFIVAMLMAAFLLTVTVGCGETPKTPPAKEAKEGKKEK